MKARALVLCISLLISVAGCKRIEKVPAVPNRIWPLVPGNWWEYHEVMQVFENNVLVQEFIDTVRMEVIREGYLNAPNPDGENEIVHLQTYEVLVSRNDLETLNYLYSDSSGIFQYSSRPIQFVYDEELGYTGECSREGFSSQSRRVLIPYPDNGSGVGGLPRLFSWGCIRDSAYAAAHYATNRDIRNLQAQGIHAVTVPAGSFDCIDYGKEDWALDIGLVRQEADYFEMLDSTEFEYKVVRELTRRGQ